MWPWDNKKPGYDAYQPTRLAWDVRMEKLLKESAYPKQPFEKVDEVKVHPLHDDPDEFVELFRDYKNTLLFNRRLQVT